MNTAYAELVRARIAGMLGESQAIRALRHHGVVGELRELLVRQVLAPLLPQYIGITSGVVISAYEQQSGQMDAILFDRRTIPPALISDRGIVPVDSALATVEVKSTLTAQELKKAHENAQCVGSLLYLPHVKGAHAEVVPSSIIGVIPALFAFDSDLSGEHKSEIERYIEIEASDSPAFRSICIVGRGCWYWLNNKWAMWPSTKEHDEVVGFLSTLANVLPEVAESRGKPRLGRYFND